MKIRLNNLFSILKQKKGLIYVIISIFILFFITCENHKIHEIKRINNVSEINIVSDENVSPRELFNHSWQIIKTNYYDKTSFNKQNWHRWKKRYSHQIKTEEDAYVAINSMLASLDDSYSKFLSKDEFLAQNSAINSKLYGIGVNIAQIAGKIYIINVLENAPAQLAGIASGDIILKVNGINVNGKSVFEVIQIIRGDIHESLNLELLRGNERFVKTVKREEINIKTIESRKITDDIGYIRISSFIGASTPQEFIIALNRLKDTKALIIDLRGNSGGLFQNAVIISNLFMKKGTIVNVIARQGKKNVYSAKDDGCIYDNPIAILIDGNSASASEILSSALRDNKRATLIGTKTYGKGLVQKIYSLPNKTGMNLTIARYLTPNGDDIDKIGVIPDYTVNFSHNDFINSVDTQLIYAQRFLEKQMQ